MLPVVAALAAAFTGHAQAEFPQRPVRIVVPYAPGGGTDINARSVAPHLAGRWGQQIVVDNRPGGHAIIGTDIVAKATPDGHTILFSASSEIATNVSLFKSLPYDPLRDLQPVTLASSTPVIVVAHPSTGIRSIRDFIAAAGRQKLSYASVGTASPQHLVGEWLKSVTKIDVVHVPFKGAGPAIADNVAGHVPVGFLALLPAVPHVLSGRLHGLAVTGAERSTALPEVPTMREAGYSEIDLVQWYGVFVPARTPRAVVQQINRSVNAALNLPEVRTRLAAGGADVLARSTPEQFGEFVRGEIDKNRRVLQIAGIRSE
ncbi:MAG: tripartite tricarboxylate transporter substrate binding protein [Burkholderiales bacterium]|nr:tripartite tricarboxylate transporter substrate binding protein [Burkholderiales bacterium]